MHTFCCDNLWKSTIMALEKPGKLGFFSYFLANLNDLVKFKVIRPFRTFVCAVYATILPEIVSHDPCAIAELLVVKEASVTCLIV